MSQHVYVLGSNSFSGAHFVAHLLEKGFEVTGVSRSSEPHPVFLPYLQSGRPPSRLTFHFLQADLNHQVDKIIDSISKNKPAYIVNFAAQGMVAESWQHPEQWFHTNTVSPIVLYEYLRHCPWLEKFVQVSTPEVYGSTSGLMRESLHYEPSTPYAVSKASADMNLLSYHKAYGFPVVFTRAANVFGPCQQLYRIVPRAVLRFLTGGILELHGGGASTRSFIHIHDVAEATLAVMRKAKLGEIFHISTRRQISIHDLVFLIAAMTEVEADKHIRVVGERVGKDSAYELDSSKLRTELGWAERYTLEQGIEHVIKWVRDNLAILQGLPQNYEHKV